MFFNVLFRRKTASKFWKTIVPGKSWGEKVNLCESNSIMQMRLSCASYKKLINRSLCQHKHLCWQNECCNCERNLLCTRFGVVFNRWQTCWCNGERRKARMNEQRISQLLVVALPLPLADITTSFWYFQLTRTARWRGGRGFGCGRCE